MVRDHLFELVSGDVHAHVYTATAQVTGEIALAEPQDVDAAVQAARAVCPAWRALPGNQRRDLLLKLAALLEQNLQPLAELLTIENGAPIIAGPFMVADAVQKFRYFAGWADKINGQTVATWGVPSHNYVAYRSEEHTSELQSILRTS